MNEQFPGLLSTSGGGLFHGGGAYLLLVQVAGNIILVVWSGCFTAFTFFSLSRLNLLRMSDQEEELGADFVEHRVVGHNILSRFEKVLRDLDLDEKAVDDVIREVGSLSLT